LGKHICKKHGTKNFGFTLKKDLQNVYILKDLLEIMFFFKIMGGFGQRVFIIILVITVCVLPILHVPCLLVITDNYQFGIFVDRSTKE